MLFRRNPKQIRSPLTMSKFLLNVLWLAKWPAPLIKIQTSSAPKSPPDLLFRRAPSRLRKRFWWETPTLSLVKFSRKRSVPKLRLDNRTHTKALYLLKLCKTESTELNLAENPKEQKFFLADMLLSLKGAHKILWFNQLKLKWVKKLPRRRQLHISLASMVDQETSTVKLLKSTE